MKNSLLIFGLVMVCILSANSLLANPHQYELNVSPFLSYLIVERQSDAGLDILTGKRDAEFTPVETQDPSFGFLDNEVWLRLDPSVYREIPEEAILQMEYVLIQHAYFYYRNKQGVLQTSHQGYKVTHGNFDRNPNYAIPLEKASTSHPIYIKLVTNGSYRAPLYIKSASVINREASDKDLLFGLYFGALLMMVLYNLFLFFALKDRNYLFYCLFITFNVLTQWIYSGYMHYKWPRFTSHLWETHLSTCILATTLFATLFTIHFLKTLRYARALHKPLVYVAWISGVICVVSPFIGYRAATLSMVFTVALSPILIWVASILALKNKNKSARYYLVGWTIYLLFSTAVSLQAANILPEFAFLDQLVRLGAVMEALFLTFALADRIQLLRRQRENARNRILKMLREKEQSTHEQNQRLEEQVYERTRELQDKQEEVLSQARVIEEQNIALFKHSEQLEELVKARTKALTETNLELVKQNVQLEQYGFITSHNLRGPIANLMGVLNIFDRKDLSNPINRQCIQHLDKATHSLDAVIKDLNKILSLKSADLNQIYEVIELEPFIKSCLDRQNGIIAQNDVKVSFQPETDIKLKTIPTYLFSILYNLVHNAIKYRALDRPSEICIKTRSYNGKLEISVADNGLGIDLDRFGEKLFGLYQRFHFHREGRGIGLHLVKTQMDILGGKIEVASKRNVGTRFRLIFNQTPDWLLNEVAPGKSVEAGHKKSSGNVTEA